MLAVGASLDSLGRFVLGQPRLVPTANPTSIFQDKSTTNQRLVIRISVSDFERSLLAAGLGEPSLHCLIRSIPGSSGAYWLTLGRWILTILADFITQKPPANLAIPLSKIAFLFPGQGAQTVGMCQALYRELPAAKALFDQAGEILGYDLADICFNGPAEKLNSTVVCHRLCTSVAWRRWKNLNSTLPKSTSLSLIHI